MATSKTWPVVKVFGAFARLFRICTIGRSDEAIMIVRISVELCSVEIEYPLTERNSTNNKECRLNSGNLAQMCENNSNM